LKEHQDILKTPVGLMSKTLTGWEDTADSILAITCKIKTGSGSASELMPVTCWNLRINLAVTLLFLIPLMYQMKLFYKYYGKQVFGTRQRIIYLCSITSIFLTITYSVLNMVALYVITSFVLHLLFCQFLGYVIVKISKLTARWFPILLHLLNITILGCFIYYLVLALNNPIVEQEVSLCPGFLDKSFASLKMSILGAWAILFLICGYSLKSLLQREDDVYLCFGAKEKKSNELFKLKVTIILIFLSEVTQAGFILIHKSYYSVASKTCPLMNFEQGRPLANIFVLGYRLATVYLPLVSLLWMTWLSSSEVELQFRDRFSEDDLQHDSRFASKLIYNVRKMTKGGKKSLLPTRHRSQINDD